MAIHVNTWLYMALNGYTWHYMAIHGNTMLYMDRLELLGGSILAGNNGVKNEFSKIAHTLNELGVLNNNQLNSLIKQYIM